ncbi:MAG: protein kinase [Chloroflexi bacterium]|nr:protein kinase [Chloroflexota bacterium]
MNDLTSQYFGGYELKELVGIGGMASIYKGFDQNLSRWVAIKTIPILAQADDDTHEELLARFRQEAQAIAQLRHPNILTIYGYGEEKGWAYIVMEYVAGGSLKDRLEPDQPFDWRQALNVVIPLSKALTLAHEQGIIHRDIKPANILMPAEDWPLLADFGLAKMLRSTVGDLTGAGQVVGTMAYAAPEQIESGKIDARADIYSLGVVLYELLTGKLPFEGNTSFDFLMARLTDPPRPLLEANPKTPAIFAPIIDRALAQDPDRRYQSMAELSTELTKVRQELIKAELSEAKIRLGIDEKIKMWTTKTMDLVDLNPVTIRLKLTASGHNIFAPNRNELIIGRASNDVTPDIDLGPYGGGKAGVSRRHNRLLRRDSGWFVEDLGSKNGTFVNGIKVIPSQMITLKEGDVIRCGQIELQFGLEHAGLS